MKVFRDSKNREWLIDVNMAAVLRVRDLAGANLTELSKGDPPLGARLSTDLFLITDVLAAIVRPQLEAAKVPLDDFLESIGGESLGAGLTALTEGLVDFFRKSGRTEQAAALTAQMKAVSTAAKKATEKIEGIDLEELVETEIGKLKIGT